MISSLRTAASALTAQQKATDVIGNNLANINTDGFKKQRLNFAETIDEVRENNGGPTETFLKDGGVTARDVQRFDTMGDLVMTNRPLDVAINGVGYFPVTLLDGSQGYVRAGNFKLDAAGRLITQSGFLMRPPISVPADAVDLVVGPNGVVIAKSGGQQQDLGQIQLAVFPNSNGLELDGTGVYTQTEASGEPSLVAPGTGGSGELVSGALERSNVDVAEEMTNLMLARRAYGMAAKAVETVDEMLRDANTLGG